MRCPFCGSAEVELISAWSGQLITSQVRCRSCRTYFEAVRDDFDGPVHTGAGQTGGKAQTGREPA